MRMSLIVIASPSFEFLFRNGKAERFIQTMLREWAYATEFQNSDQRKADLPKWQHRYNWHRPHASLNRQTPISRLDLNQDNLLKLHI